jgi:hypothetical protein
MKVLRIAAALALLCSPAMALEPNLPNKSSFTTTSHSGYIASSYLDQVIVSTGSTFGTLKLYNSTWTTAGQIASVTLGTLGSYDFSNQLVKGLFVVITQNVNGVTILYK